MRASISIINLASTGVQLILGREKRSRLLSSWNLALLSRDSSSEDEVFIGEDNMTCEDDQGLAESLELTRNECLVQPAKATFNFSGNAIDMKNIKMAKDGNRLKEMKVILESCGWILGSPESYERINLDECNIVRILNDLFDGSKDASLALSFFQWSECYLGLKNTIRSTCVMIHILVAGNMSYRAMDLIIYLIRKNGGKDRWLNFLLRILLETHTSRKILVTVYSMIVDCCVKENMTHVALKLAFKLKHLNIIPSIGVCNSIIGALLKSEELELAWDFLEEMLNQGMGLNASIFSLFIDKYCTQGNLRSGWEILVAMQEHGICPDIVAYTPFIDGLCKMSLLREAVSLIFKLTLIGISVDSVSVSAVIDGLCKMGKMEKAVSILELFSLPPNIYVYNSFISKLCADSNMAVAYNIFNEMSELGFVADCFIYTSIISGYCRIRNLNMACCFLAKMMKRGIEPSVTTYSALIDYYCKSGEVEIAEQLFQQMIVEGLIPDLVSYNTLIDGYGKMGHLQRAFGLLDMMKSAGIFPDNFTYNTLVHSLVLRGFVTEANELVEELTRRGFSPDIVTFTSIASGFTKKGSFKEAFLVWLYMSEHMKPDVVMCSAVLNGYCRARLMKEANALFLEMVNVGLIPDLILYNTLIHGFCSVGNIDDACSLVESMVKQGILPNDVTYRALILGCEKKMIQHPLEAAAFKLQQILLKYKSKMS